MAITAVPDYDDLVQDYTIEPGGSAGNFVAQSFVIATTAPLRIDGGASADLSNSPRTLSANTFGAGASGIVPASGGGTTNFLRADGTWASPVGSGGYTTIQEEGVDLTQRGKINFICPDITAADDAGNSRTNVTLTRFGAANGGTVAASGGGTSNFLRADGTWVAPGVPGGISLQVSTPGTADVGNGHITGTMIADTRVVGGPASSVVGNAAVESYNSALTYGLFSRAAGAGSVTPMILQQRAAGTLGSPTATTDNLELGGFVATGYSTSGAWSGSIASGLVVKADGNASATRQPTYMNLVAGDIGNYFHSRFSSAGARFESGLSSGPANATRALHTVDVQGTFGIKAKSFASSGGGTYNYTQVESDPSVYLIQADIADVQVSLLSASGRAGRIYTFIATGLGGHYIVLAPSGVEKINGEDAFYFQRTGDAVSIISDGTNWWTIERPDSGDLSSHIADGTTVANTVVETALIPNLAIPTQLQVGATFKIHIGGKYSTTGTPTLRFRVKNTAVSTIADSTAITCPSGVTDKPWFIEFESAISNTTSYTGRVVRAALHLTDGTGVTTQYNMISTFGNPPNGALPVSITAEWGTASASNTITHTGMVFSVAAATIQV